MHVLLTMWALGPRIENGSWDCTTPIAGFGDPQFLLTFISSTSAASLGISKFLKSGPCRFMRNDTFLMGFGSMGYVLLSLNIATTIVGRGCIITSFFFQNRRPDFPELGLQIFINLVPQLAMVSCKVFVKKNTVSTYHHLSRHVDSS